MLHEQYEFVKGSRRALLDYCAKMDPVYISAPVPTFNNSNIAYLLTHITDTYKFWLGEFGLGKEQHYYGSLDVKSLLQVYPLFDEVNALVDLFIQTASDHPDKLISGKVSNGTITVQFSGLQLFTHVITHEFHHKGQILTMSRHWGYIPVDTDIIRLS